MTHALVRTAEEKRTSATRQDLQAGATLRMPVTDMFWGDRYGVIVDPFGHSWSVATHQRDMTAQEIQEAMQKMASCGGANATHKA